jgi:hypothetical protein
MSQATLQQFVNTYNQLTRCSFTKYLEEGNKLLFNYSVQASTGITVSLHIPKDEEMRAFLLTFRLFIQDRDGISFRMLAKLAQEDITLSLGWRTRYTDIYVWIQDYLAQKTCVTFQDGTSPKYYDVLFTFLYGELAHIEPKYQSALQRWKSNITTHGLLWRDFNAILLQLYYVIKEIARFSEQEICGHVITDE